MEVNIACRKAKASCTPSLLTSTPSLFENSKNILQTKLSFRKYSGNISKIFFRQK